MAELKTRPTDASVEAFLDAVEDDARRADCLAVAKIMKRVTKAKPKMWGPSIVGFGSQRLRYASGRELDWPRAAFSPRKKDLTLYITPEFPRRAALMKKLGLHKCGKSCLYIRSLADVDLAVLEDLIRASAVAEWMPRTAKVTTARPSSARKRTT